MNIENAYALGKILEELEVALQIDGSDLEERNIDVVLGNVRKRIYRQYNIDITTGIITDPALDMSKSRNEVALFIDNIARLHAKLGGFCQIERYLTESQVDLRDLNYFGYREDSLMQFLIYLQRKETLPAAKEAIESLKLKLGTISISKEKRLMLILIVAYDLGLFELTATIAEIFYLSMN